MTIRAFIRQFGATPIPPPDQPPMTASVFLETLYRLHDEQRLHAMTDHIMGYFDDCLEGGHHEVCDEILAAVDLIRIGTSGIRTLTLCGSWGRDRLRAWPDFAARARIAMVEKCGEAKASRLLDRILA